jgi:hypothetical protein
MGYDRKYGRVTTERGTIGPDEPVFLIRARDVSAPDALYAYASAAESHGAGETLCTNARKRGDEIAAWQAEHPELVRVPTVKPGQIKAT